MGIYSYRETDQAKFNAPNLDPVPVPLGAVGDRYLIAFDGTPEDLKAGQTVVIEAVDPLTDPDYRALKEHQIALVVEERDRRLGNGFDYNFGDDRAVHRIGTSEADMQAWTREVTPYADALVLTGDEITLITLVTDTGPVQVTGLEWQQILVAAGQHRQPIWAASFALQAMNPIPEDYSDDGYWP